MLKSPMLSRHMLIAVDPILMAIIFMATHGKGLRRQCARTKTEVWLGLLNKVVLFLVTLSCPTRHDPMDYRPLDSPDKNVGVVCHALLQGIFPTQRSNPVLPHCSWSLYFLSHQGSLWILEWVAYSFSWGSSWSRDWTRVPCVAGRFFTSWTTREVQ